MPSYKLTSAWQKVASAGQTVEVENLSNAAAVIMTSTGGPPPTADGLVLFGQHPSEQFALTQDLYARANADNVTIEVTAGFQLGTSAPVTMAAVISPGTPVAPGRKALINCSAAGAMRLKLSGGSTIDIALQVGESELDGYAVVDVVAANTTATATVTVLS